MVIIMVMCHNYVSENILIYISFVGLLLLYYINTLIFEPLNDFSLFHRLPGIPGNVQEGDIPYKISVFQRVRILLHFI